MPDRPRRWMTVPRVRDPIQQQQAALLQTLLLAILAIGSLAIVIGVALAGAAALSPRTLLPNLLVLSCTAGALLMLRRGAFVWSVRIVTAILLVVMGETFLTTPFSLTSGLLIEFVIPITLAGLLLGRRELIASSILSVLIVVGGYLVEQSGPATVAAQTRALSSLIIFVLVIALFTLFLDQFGRALRTALRTTLQREQDAHAQRTRYEVTLSSIGDAVIATDERGWVSFMNRPAEELTGWTMVEADGRPLDEVFVIVNESTRQPVESPASRVLREGKVVGLANHTVVIARDGSERPIDDSGAPIFDSQGKMTGVVMVFHDIAVRRQAEAVLARYQLLYEHARDILLFMELDGRIIEANRAAVTAYGYPYEQLLTMRIHDLRSAMTLPQIGMQLAQANGQGVLFETMHRRGDGTPFPVEVSARGADIGNKRLVVSVIRDITQRRLAEREQRELAAIVAASDDAIVGMTPDAVISTWNAGAERLFGYTAVEMIGQPSRVLSPPDRQSEVPTILERVRSGDPVQRYETERVRKDGSRIFIAVSVSPILGADGQVEGISAIARDITERVRWEDRQRFLVDASTILAGTLDLSATLDGLAQLAVPFLADWCAVDMPGADGRIERVAVAHIDPAKIELVRESQRRFAAADERPQMTHQILKTAKAQLIPEITDAMLVAQAHDADHLRFMRELGLHSWMCVPLVVQGRALGALTFVTADSGRRYDASDLQFAEDLARRAALAVDNARLYREAQEAIRARDAFLSIASHEINTPLTGLQGYLQLLQRRVDREGSLNERDRRALRVVGDQAHRLQMLVDEMLNISRIEIGLFNVERRPMDLAATVRRVVDEIQVTLQNHAITLELEAEPVPIHGDERRLEQVLQNLLGNAIKYSPNGGELSVRLERSGGYANLAITDHGIGIPEREVGQLFQRFYRAANIDSAQISGFGLGLYLVKEIVSRHDGTVDVVSREGQGSTFTVRLPLA